MGLLMLGNGLQGSLISLRANMDGFSTEVIGLVMSAYSLGFVAGSLLTPRLLKNVGHIRVFAALASLASTAILFHGLLVEPTFWGGMRFISGFCYAGLYVVAESWLNDSSNNQNRGQLLSIYMVILIGGMALGQLLLNLASPGGFELFILTSVLISFALVPILLTPSPSPGFQEATPLGLKALFKSSPLGVSGCFITGMSNAALLSLSTIYAKMIGLSIGQISIFVGIALAGSVLFQWPVGRLSDRKDRRWMIVGVTLLASASATGMAMLPLTLDNMVMLFVLMAVFGGLSFPLYSLCLSHTNDYLDSSQRVAASSRLVLITGVGGAIGPTLAAPLMSHYGPVGLFYFLAAIHAALALFALAFMKRATPHQTQSLPVMSTSPLTSTQTLGNTDEMMTNDRS
jgi:MFS family permease